MKKFLIFAIIISLAYMVYADSNYVQFVKHRHIEKTIDMGNLTVFENPTKENSPSPNGVARLIYNPNISVSYRASRSGNSVIPVLNIRDAILSDDQSLLILLESARNSNEENLNRIIFFDTANNRIINAFEFNNTEKEYIQGALTLNNFLVVEEFNKKEKKFSLQFYPLTTKKFNSAKNSHTLPGTISDLLIHESSVFVKIADTPELICYQNGLFHSKVNCREKGGKLLLSPQGDIINITAKGTEFFRIGNEQKLYSFNFNNIAIDFDIDFVVPIQGDLMQILIGNDEVIKNLVNLKTLSDSDFATTNGIIQYNFKQNYLLTLSGKKEQLFLHYPDLLYELTYNTLKPRSKTLIEKLFFFGENDSNIMILCESGELFLLHKERRKFKKTLLFKF